MRTRLSTGISLCGAVVQQSGSGRAAVSVDVFGDIMRLVIALSLREREAGQPLGWKQ